jgi:diguanylate cyclase (GGDEF)-like protein
VFRRGQQQAIVELQEGFDHERRQRELGLLERESRLKDAQLLNRELHQWLWVAGTAVGLLLLGTGALLYRRVRASNAHLAHSNAQLLVLSERDPLTGLANRRHFQVAMREGDGRLEGTVFLIDIDHFKQINDQHGHAAGDTVLVEVARRLRATLRDEDLVVRWGGEEFLVVVRSLAPERVEALAERLLAALAAEPMGEAQIAVSASIGFATFPIEPGLLAVGWERAIHLVDTAMYLAKAHGRNRAYGVRLLDADDETQLDALMRELEPAWRAGRVALTLLRGPVSAPATSA